MSVSEGKKEMRSSCTKPTKQTATKKSSSRPLFNDTMEQLSSPESPLDPPKKGYVTSKKPIRLDVEEGIDDSNEKNDENCNSLKKRPAETPAKRAPKKQVTDPTLPGTNVVGDLRSEVKQMMQKLFYKPINEELRKSLKSEDSPKISSLVLMLEPNLPVIHDFFRRLQSKYPKLNTVLAKRCPRKVPNFLLIKEETDYQNLLESNTSKLAYETIYKDLHHMLSALKPDALVEKLQKREIKDMISEFKEEAGVKLGDIDVITESDILKDIGVSSDSENDSDVDIDFAKPARNRNPTPKGAEYIVDREEHRTRRVEEEIAPREAPRNQRAPPRHLLVLNDPKRGFSNEIQQDVTAFISKEIVKLRITNEDLQLVEKSNPENFKDMRVITLNSIRKQPSIDQQKLLSIVSFPFRYQNKPSLLFESGSVTGEKFFKEMKDYFEKVNPVFAHRPSANHLLIPQAFFDALLVLQAKRTKEITFELAYDRMVKFLFLSVAGYMTHYSVRTACNEYPTVLETLRLICNANPFNLEFGRVFADIANHCGNYYVAQQIGWKAALSMASNFPDVTIFTADEFAIANLFLHPLLRCKIYNEKRRFFENLLPSLGTGAELDVLFLSLMLSVLFPEHLKNNPMKNLIYGMIVFIFGLAISPGGVRICGEVIGSVPDGEIKESILASCGK